MDVKVEQVLEPVLFGEGPHWDAEQQCLYFVSISDRAIHKYDPATRKETKATFSESVGFIIPLTGTKDQFVISLGRKVVTIKWNGENSSDVEILSTVAEVDSAAGVNTNRINDGKADPRGRLFAGTMGKEESPGIFQMNNGSLYSFNKSGAQMKAQNISISNGLSWDINRKAMYYIDTFEFQVRGYDYEFRTGNMSNQRVAFDFKKNDVKGFPDGMAIDTEGNLWVACYEGSQVIKVDPVTGALLQQIPIPCLEVTSVAFGGEDLDVLYVTSKIALFQITGVNAKGFPGEACIL